MTRPQPRSFVLPSPQTFTHLSKAFVKAGRSPGDAAFKRQLRPMPTKTTTTPKPAAPTLARKIRAGFVSHTELASSDPAATKAWCTKVLGWKFGEAVPTPTGPYNMWQFDEGSGGGIRATNKGEPAGTTPFVEVNDIKTAHASAIKAGAKEMYPPMSVGEGMGWISCVQAPGGPAVGFWSNK